MVTLADPYGETRCGRGEALMLPSGKEPRLDVLYTLQKRGEGVCMRRRAGEGRGGGSDGSSVSAVPSDKKSRASLTGAGRRASMGECTLAHWRRHRLGLGIVGGGNGYCRASGDGVMLSSLWMASGNIHDACSSSSSRDCSRTMASLWLPSSVSDDCDALVLDFAMAMRIALLLLLRRGEPTDVAQIGTNGGGAVTMVDEGGIGGACNVAQDVVPLSSRRPAFAESRQLAEKLVVGRRPQRVHRITLPKSTVGGSCGLSACRTVLPSKHKHHHYHHHQRKWTQQEDERQCRSRWASFWGCQRERKRPKVTRPLGEDDCSRRTSDDCGQTARSRLSDVQDRSSASGDKQERKQARGSAGFPRRPRRRRHLSPLASRLQSGRRRASFFFSAGCSTFIAGIAALLFSATTIAGVTAAATAAVTTGRASPEVDARGQERRHQQGQLRERRQEDGQRRWTELESTPQLDSRWAGFGVDGGGRDDGIGETLMPMRRRRSLKPTNLKAESGSLSGSDKVRGADEEGQEKVAKKKEPKGVSALVIGGNFTLNGQSTNVAQYDPVSRTWYTRFEPKLYLYGKAAGVVSDLAVWRSGSSSSPYDLLYVVGSFDTICKACQQQYCSAGVWTGQEFDKIGDGLCGVPRATDATMKMLTSVLTPDGNFFVGGTFESRVWSGEKFVYVQNVAVYNPRKNAWLPLQEDKGGGLGCNWSETRVMSLAWNDRDEVLYIGGKFNLVDSEYIQPGLAIWSNKTGIAPFPGGGVSFNTPWWGDSSWVYDGVVTSLTYHDGTRSLYVAGTFERVNGEAPCKSIAVWRVDEGSWACLHEPRHGFSLVTSLLYTGETLYVAGVPDESSSWSETWRDGYDLGDDRNVDSSSAASTNDASSNFAAEDYSRNDSAAAAAESTGPGGTSSSTSTANDSSGKLDGEVLVANFSDVSDGEDHQQQQHHHQQKQQRRNATKYTIARMSLSPARFQGKYERWGGDSATTGSTDDTPTGEDDGASSFSSTSSGQTDAAAATNGSQKHGKDVKGGQDKESDDSGANVGDVDDDDGSSRKAGVTQGGDGGRQRERIRRRERRLDHVVRRAERSLRGQHELRQDAVLDGEEETMREEKGGHNRGLQSETARKRSYSDGGSEGVGKEHTYSRASSPAPTSPSPSPTKPDNSGSPTYGASGYNDKRQGKEEEDRGYDFGGRVYYGSTGGVNCTAASGSKGKEDSDATRAGDGRGEGGGGTRDGRYKPMCGVDVVVSPGGDNKYRFYWEWLPGFSGVPGRINELGGGEDSFGGSVFIGGEFKPPVLVWRNDPYIGPSTTTIGEEGELRGSVTSIAQMMLRPPAQPGSHSSGSNSESGGAAAQVAHDGNDYESTMSPDQQQKDENHALLMAMVLTCVTLGVCLGAGMAFVCHKQEFVHLPWLKDMVEGRNGISLTTLAGPHGLMAGAEAEFKLRFERAMQARHLSKGHNLNIINPKEIMLHKIIGEGSFGRVWSGRWRSSSVAVKEFVFAQAAITGGSLQRNELIEEIVGEAAIMSFLPHPRILHLYGCSLTSQAIWIVSELCSRGSLRQVLDDRNTPLSPRTRLRIAVDVAEGMLYLHTRDEPIIHRDLKSHNIFMQEDNDGQLQPKIGDWGSARAVALYTGDMRTMTHGVGTACWLAPEVIKHAKGSKQADVYAFGILLWELATREEVYLGLSAAQIIDRVANQGLRPKAPRACPWCDLMVACWQEDPQKRPTFREIVDVSTALLKRMGGALPTPQGSRALEIPVTQRLLPAPSPSTEKKNETDSLMPPVTKPSTPKRRASSRDHLRLLSPTSTAQSSPLDGIWGYSTGGHGKESRSSSSYSSSSSRPRYKRSSRRHSRQSGGGGGGGFAEKKRGERGGVGGSKNGGSTGGNCNNIGVSDGGTSAAGALDESGEFDAGSTTSGVSVAVGENSGVLGDSHGVADGELVVDGAGGGTVKLRLPIKGGRGMEGIGMGADDGDDGAVGGNSNASRRASEKGEGDTPVSYPYLSGNEADTEEL